MRSSCPRRRWRSGSCAPRRRSRPPAFPFACRRRTCCPTGWPRCWPSSTSSSTRATAGAASLPRRRFRLGRALVELMPDEPEAAGLLALMLLHDARRDARRARRGARAARRAEPAVVRRHADRKRPARSSSAPSRSEGAGRTSSRQRSRRCTSTSPATGTRSQRCTAELARTARSPVVELNRAVAVAEVEGPAAGLGLVDALELPTLPLPALNARGSLAAPRAACRGAGRLRAGGRAHERRRRAAVPRTAHRRALRWLIGDCGGCGEGLHQAAWLTRPGSRPVGLGTGRGGRDAPRAGPQPRPPGIPD